MWICEWEIMSMRHFYNMWIGKDCLWYTFENIMYIIKLCREYNNNQYKNRQISSSRARAWAYSELIEFVEVGKIESRKKKKMQKKLYKKWQN